MYKLTQEDFDCIKQKQAEMVKAGHRFTPHVQEVAQRYLVADNRLSNFETHVAIEDFNDWKISYHGDHIDVLTDGDFGSQYESIPFEYFLDEEKLKKYEQSVEDKVSQKEKAKEDAQTQRELDELRRLKAKYEDI